MRHRHKVLRSQEERNRYVLQYRFLPLKIVRELASHIKDKTFFDDLVQEGMLGLVWAADLYDPDKKTDGKTTKAMTYFYNSIRQWVTRAMWKNRLVAVPEHHFFHPPEDDTLKECIARTYRVSPMPSGYVDPCPNESLGEEVASMLGCLLPRERRILELRFGLNGETPHTLEEVGEIIGKTKERVRQIQREALERIRRHKGEPCVSK
jgi:RNA polymerase sigma factor (sigma-70 family)